MARCAPSPSPWWPAVLGNLLDRLQSPLGVVDFIDIGVGNARFWTFNLADVGVTVGAVLLAIVLWREDGMEAAS